MYRPEAHSQQADAPDRAKSDPAPSTAPARIHLPRQLYRKLGEATAAYANGLKQDPEFSSAIQSDPKGFRSDVQRLIRLQFPLRRGRPRDPLLEVACSMIEQGKSVPEVLRSQIQGWEKLDTYTRLLASKGLDQAYRRRDRKGTELPPQEIPS